MKRVFLLFVCSFCACSSETLQSRTATGTLSEIDDAYIAETAAKAESSAPHGPYLEPPNWREAATFRRGDVRIFSQPEREKLQQIRLPVLGPNDRDFLQTPIIVHREHWYTISSKQEDLTFYIKGSTLEFRTTLAIPHPPKEEISISRSHGIVTASFRRFGASYHLDVECTSPERDPRCADDETVRHIVNTLVMYGGAP